MRAKKQTETKKTKINKKRTTPKGSPGAVQSGSAITINGIIKGDRVPSRILEEQIQQAVKDGARDLHIIADGQHGIGGRIWPRDETVSTYR